MRRFAKYNKHHKNFLILLMVVVVTILAIIDASKIYASQVENQAVYIPIIMYHQVKNKDLGKDVISPQEFESDLKYLSDNNYHTITMTQLINYVYEDEELPPNPVILTFDDGYLTTYKYVYPLLQKYQMKIIISIVGKSTDDFTRVNDTHIEYAHLTWGNLIEMQESGLIEIQNHSYNLHKVKNGRYGAGRKYNESEEQYKQMISEDVTMLQDKVTNMAGTTPNTFTYPYGKYNDCLEETLKELGFRATLSCTFGVNIISKDPEKLYGLKRICRAHNQSIGKIIKDGMETLKYIKE